jgi:hypothetical protein
MSNGTSDRPPPSREEIEANPLLRLTLDDLIERYPLYARSGIEDDDDDLNADDYYRIADEVHALIGVIGIDARRCTLGDLLWILAKLVDEVTLPIVMKAVAAERGEDR